MFSQYSDFFSIYIYVLLLIPAVILGLLGKKIKYYGILVSIPALLMLFIQSIDLSWNIKTYYKLIQFIVFIVSELILILLFQYYWNKNKNIKVYYFLMMKI